MPKTPKGFIEKLFPVLLGGAIVMAFIIGILWEKVGNLEKGGVTTTTKAQPTTTTPQAQQQQAPTATLDQIKKLFSADLLKFGDANRKVLFVEVSDPSCPYCSIATGKNGDLNKQAGDRFKLVADGGTYVAPVPEMRKLVDQGKASMVIIYTPGHGNGEMGMKALYCANEKGKYWEVSDLLYSSKGYDLMNNTIKNDKTKSGDLAEFLKSAINPSDLKSCLDSGKYDARLTSDTQVAASIGIQGTPGFYVNATNFAGAYSWKDIESVVTAALK